MTNGLIEANKGILKKIFSEEFWFIVPEYQRPYVWQEENIQELIDDLYYAFENKQNSEYFLGALVLKTRWPAKAYNFMYDDGCSKGFDEKATI